VRAVARRRRLADFERASRERGAGELASAPRHETSDRETAREVRKMTTILITGAGSGLNNGAALELASRGYDVIACVENYPQRRALELQAKASGLPLRIEKLDVTREGDRRQALSWDVDILVNGAGILEGGAIVDIPADNFRRQFEVNLFGPVALTKAIARSMAKRRSGRIVFMSSVVGILTGPFVGAYAASKHAIEAVAGTMAMELQEFGIEIAVINPGPFLTGFNDSGFLTPRTWDDDPSERLFDYDKLAFPFEQFEPAAAFASIADAIVGKSPLFRNVVTPGLAAGVREQSELVWTRRSSDGLGTRADLVARSYELRPETLAE
jgi:NAD(P)-dependent dehydrogenase (short-subunit alcohol dehydrogenase family)